MVQPVATRITTIRERREKNIGAQLCFSGLSGLRPQPSVIFRVGLLSSDKPSQKPALTDARAKVSILRDSKSSLVIKVGHGHGPPLWLVRPLTAVASVLGWREPAIVDTLLLFAVSDGTGGLSWLPADS